MAVYARLWTELTGARVIGLTTSTNAAEVLAGEGLPETYNIAQFLGKVKDSDTLRHPVPIGPGDVLVVDEATQVSTSIWHHAAVPSAMPAVADRGGGPQLPASE